MRSFWIPMPPPTESLLLRFVFFSLICIMSLAGPVSHAHESRPAFLEITETGDSEFSISWRRPARGNSVLRLAPVFPENCRQDGDGLSYIQNNASIEKWTISCGQPGLEGRVIAIEGLDKTLTDVLVRITLHEGIVISELLNGASPSFTVDQSPTKLGVIADYFKLGVEHILGGIDHLLFVLCLMWVTSGWFLLVKTITAFTVAHSITLAVSALGYVTAPQAPVEAIIALSIVFLARELIITHNEPIKTSHSATLRYPWVVAFVFGLLHGFGFAGALNEIGLPQNEIPLALLMFNLGVEAGQLLFIGLIILIGESTAKLDLKLPRWLKPVCMYGVGVVAAFWLIERVAGFWA